MTLLCLALAILPAQADPLPPGAVARLGSARFRVPGHVTAAALSPDGKAVAVYQAGGHRLTLFDVPTGKVLRRLDTTGMVFGRELTFSPDGKHVVGLSSGVWVTFLDAVTGKSRKLDRGRSSGSMSLMLSADGKRLAARDETGDHGVPPQVWDVATGKLLFAAENARRARLGAALSDDGRCLASWDRSGRELRLWDVDSGKETRRLAVAGRQVVEAAFSPDGKSLAVAEFPQRVSFWDLASGKEVAAVEAPRINGAPFRFSPDGQLLVARTADKGFAVWDVATRRRLGLVPDPESVPWALAFPSPGKALVAGVRNQAVCLWELPPGKALAPRPGHRAGITALEFLPDGKSLCSAGSDGVRWWDLAAGKETRHGALRIRDVWGQDLELAVRLSPGARHLSYLGSLSGEARICAAPSLEELLQAPVANGNLWENRTAFSAGRLVSLCPAFRGDGYRTDLTLWDLAARKKLRQLEGPGGSEYHAALTPDGRTLALLVNAYEGPDAKQRYHLRCWEAAGREIAASTQEGCWAEAFALSPAGDFLVTAEKGGDVWLWHVPSGAKLLQLEKAPRGAAHAARFSPDGRTLAVGASDPAFSTGQVLVWEVITGKLRLTLEGHEGAATALAFSPDGRRLATGGADGTVLLWDRTRRPEDRPLADRIPAKELEGLWEALNHPDAVAGHRAVLRLAAAPGDAVPLLARHLKPAPGKAPTEEEIAGHIAGLDADDFAARERASEALAEAGPLAENALRKALDSGPSPEKALRLRRLLDKLVENLLSPERVRPTRALEVLERAGTPEARALLERLTRGGRPTSR